MDKEPRQDNSQPSNSTPLGRFVRLTWKTLGTLLLFLLLILIVITPEGTAKTLQGVFWLVVAGLVVLRYLDMTVFRGQTGDDKPATMSDWLRYSAGLVLMSGFFWFLAQAIRLRTH
ncbi:MAG TPA: hypothetical protein PKM41_08520 [Deltaproteobacteria bacterium]|jgi:hypothetical protein|nr:hypothetical protein [Deltaproteobacteria bacterium]HOI07333.1 hypothetical protein [Deltaproteobacteria bacterium]